MNSAQPPHEGEWSFSQLERIDAVCDAFEKSWSGNGRRTIEEFLAANADLPLSSLLYELLRVEIYLRLDRGEAVEQGDYQRRFAGHDATIARAWHDARARFPAAPVADDVTLSWHGAAAASNPQSIGRFKIIRRLGKGGFGTVYLARDPTCNHDVAIKLLHQDLLASPQRREEFIREAQIGATLDHPHLVHTLGVEQEGERLLIVQEFIDGSNLAEWHAAHQPTPEQIAALLIPVARALAYLHEHQYVHRDLKTENILIDRSERPFVSDFGLVVHEDEQRHRRGEFAGTRPYMSPEQVRGQIELIDGRSDIWSLGVILYRLVTDRLPFGGPPPRRGSDAREAYYKDLKYEIQEHDPKPLRQIRPALSRRLEEICLRCLEKRQRDRYQTGHDLAEDLLLYLGRSAGPDGSSVPLLKRAPVLPKGLRSFDEHDKDFFLDLLPGPRRSDGLPASVAFWLNRLTGTETVRPLDIGVLFGPSGSGKSSLVKAGLLPRLEDDFVPLLIEATATDTEVRLLKALRGAFPQLPQDASVVDGCRYLSESGGAARSRVLLVIDQFEQWLYSHPDVSRTQLLAGLKHCNGTRLQVLLLVRDDFWMPLTRAMEQLEVAIQEGKNAAAVDLFDRDHARKVLLEFGRAYQRLPAEDSRLTDEHSTFLDQAIDGLAEGGRIVCVRLALFAEMMKERPWTPGELQAVGGAQGIGVAFLEEKFGPRAPVAYRPHRDAVRRILESLLPPSGSDLKGQSHTTRELRAVSGYVDDRAFAQLIDILDGELRILTPYAPDVSFADAHSGVPTASVSDEGAYQLTHDFLVPSIRDWLTSDLRRTRSGRAMLRLRERSDDYQRRPEPRRLPSLLEWLSIRLLVPRRSWTVPQRTMMAVATRRLVGRVALLVAGFTLMSALAWDLRGRWQARTLLDSLLSTAATVKVPEIARQAKSVDRWARPAFQEAYAREFSPSTNPEAMDDDQFRRQLHLGLVLGSEDPSKFAPILDQISRVPPEDLSTVITMLGSPSASLIESLGRRLEVARTRGGANLVPLAVLLGNLAPDDDRLRPAAADLASHLRDARPGEFAVWQNHLRPLAKIIRPELLGLWRSLPSGRTSQRVQLAESLGQLGAGDVETLVAAIEDAEPADFSALIPPVQKIGDVAYQALESRINQIRRDAIAPPYASADTQLPATELSQQVESVSGRLGRFGGLALAVKRSEIASLCDRLASAGYAPRSIRPYQKDDNRLATITWHRDRREFRIELDRTAGDFRLAIERHETDGFQPVDLAYAAVDGPTGETSDGQRVTWSGVWVRREPGDPDVLFEFDVSEDEREGVDKKRNAEGFLVVAGIVRRDSAGKKWWSTIWSRLDQDAADEPHRTEFKSGASAFLEEPRKLDAYGDLFPGYFQTDLRADWIPSDAAPQFSGVWRSRDDEEFTSHQFLGDSSRQLLESTVGRFEQGYVPSIVAPYSTSATGTIVWGSLWYRPVRSRADAIHDAKRIANLTLALAHCGRRKALDELLADDAPDRDPRSFAIERIASSGVPAALVCGGLDAAPTTTARRSILLALGGYPVSSIPAATRELVRQWAADEPDAAVHSAATWCLRQWSPAGEVSEFSSTAGVPAPNDQPSPVDRKWYVNEEGHVMVVLPAGEFRMGSPERETDRDGTEMQVWMRIPRRYSLAATFVTVGHFRRFLTDENVMCRLPPIYFELLSKERNELTDRMWRVDCPQTGLTRLEAMMYCEWLSERAGIPVEDRCYPDIWDVVEKWVTATEPRRPDYTRIPAYQPGPTALNRRGYRLPTEAEWECACRAGCEQARHFGDSDELLEAYGWFRANTGGKLQPVAGKKPNEFGFFDMLGNASQYCQDPYHNIGRTTNFLRVDNGNLSRVAPQYIQRGGDFDSPPRDLRSANRVSASPANNRFTNGFRVARTE